MVGSATDHSWSFSSLKTFVLNGKCSSLPDSSSEAELKLIQAWTLEDAERNELSHVVMSPDYPQITFWEWHPSAFFPKSEERNPSALYWPTGRKTKRIPLMELAVGGFGGLFRIGIREITWSLMNYSLFSLHSSAFRFDRFRALFKSRRLSN